MERKVSSLKILNIIVCIILLITFAIIGTRITAHANTAENSEKSEVLPSIQLGYNYPSLFKQIKPKTNYQKDLIIAYNLDYYINKNIATIKFFAKAFDYELVDVINILKQREAENKDFIVNNIGYLKDSNGNLYVYDNFEYGLIEFFYDLNNNYSSIRNVKYIPYTKDSAYVEKLIMYYSTIYKNVDRTTLLSIGAAESGYYKVKYMLKYNNIYGGMTKNRLIKHNNIEIGVLSYVRMMSKYYYGIGLNDLQSIGKKYCPVYESGEKQASSHWINLVTYAKNKYQKYTDDITINDLTNNTIIL